MSMYSPYEVYPSSYDKEDTITDLCPFNFKCGECEYDCDFPRECGVHSLHWNMVTEFVEI